MRGYALLCAKAAVTGEKTRGRVTPERRARIAQALVRAMARYEERPKELFWADRYVELLGLTASGSDKRVLERLERLRPYAGSARRTVVEKLDPDHLPYPYPANFPADVIKPGFRVSSLGTGLLDIEVLETALKRIRARS